MKKAILILLILVVGFVVFNILSSKSSPTDERPLPAADGELATSTASGKISFVSRRDGVDHIYLMNADGTGVVQLTRGKYSEQTPEWSSDGSKLVFNRSEDGQAIYTMNADGSNLKRISPTPGRDVLPGWSPDGTKIIYTRVVDPRNGPPTSVTDIMVMNADGTEAKTVYSNGDFNMEPRWSPDGSTIAFMCGKAGVGVQVCAMGSDGTNVRKLTNVAGAVHGDPHWSNDGTKIAFGSNREGDGKVNVFIMNADGSNVRQITHRVPPYEAGDTGWSPDDKQLVFEWDVDGKSQSDPTAKAMVWIINADGTGLVSTHQACSGVGCAPRWQPTQIASMSD